MENNIRKLARLYAKLYIHLAREMVSQFGEEGKKTVCQGIRNFALERGNEVMEKALSKGQSLTMKNFYGNFDSSLVDAGFQMELDLRDWDADGLVTHCPFAEIWQEMGEEELGRIYCNVDEDMLEGYNPELKLDRPEIILEGSKQCVFHWTKKEGIDEHQG